MHMYITLYLIRIPASKINQGILLNITATILATEPPQQQFISLFFHYFTNTKTILFQLHAPYLLKSTADTPQFFKHGYMQYKMSVFCN